MRFRACFWVVIVMALFVPSVISAAEPATNTPQQNKPAYSPEYGVRTIYFIPKNREPQPDAVRKIKEYVKIAQQFFSMKNAEYGFYVAGTTKGKTFFCDTDENGEPYVHIIRGAREDTYYQERAYVNVLDELFKQFSEKNSVLLVFTECYQMHEDGTITGGAMGGTNFMNGGPIGGYALVGGDTIWFLDRTFWNDNRKYDGMKLPQFNNIPLVNAVSYPGFQGDTIASNSSVYFGAITHELGHGFGLPHCFARDGKLVAGDLMGNGCRAFRGVFGEFPGEDVGMCKWDTEFISTSRFFNPEPRTDFVAPIENSEVTLEHPCSSDMNVHVKLRAQDKDSGLFRNVIAMLPPGSQVTSIPYDKGGRAEVRIKHEDVPVTGLAPRSYILFLRPIDNQGNRGEKQIWVPVPARVAQQYCDSRGNWIDVAPGKKSANGNIRFVLSLTGPAEYRSVTPEIEIRQMGKPFTGRPNYIGPKLNCGKEAVEAIIPAALGPGHYRWRYRIRSNDKDFPVSCWVTFGTDDTRSMDIDISGAPAFIASPKSQTRCVGQETVLKTKLVGVAPIFCRWRKNGRDIPNATSATFWIKSTKPSDAGVYDCRIKNAAGSLISKPATLTVVKGRPLEITTQPVSQNVTWTWGTNIAKGKPVKASHAFRYDPPESAVDGNTEPRPRWTTYACSGTSEEWLEVDLQGACWISAINARIYDDDSGVRTPKSVEYFYRDTTGEWKLIAVNGSPLGSIDGSKTNTIFSGPINATAIRVVLKKNPKFQGVEGVGLTELEVLAGTVGARATFSVVVKGSRPVTYQWRKDGAEIPGATARTLIIPAAMPDYAGVYDCIIKNACTEVHTLPATLTVSE